MVLHNVVILAAGRGRRSRELIHEIPKALFPFEIGSKTSCLLGRLLSQLELLDVKEIFLIVGYRGDLFRLFVENWVNRDSKHKPREFPKISVIDSGKEWQKGPLFSFLSLGRYLQSKNLQNSENFKRPFFLIPADTWFDQTILEEIFYSLEKKKRPSLSSFDNHKRILFWAKPIENNNIGNGHEKGNYIQIKNPSATNGEIKKFVSIDQIFQDESNEYNKSHYYMAQILPILAFYHDIFGLIEPTLQQKHQTVFGVIKNLFSQNKLKAFYSLLNVSGDSIIDFDTPTDWKMILEKI
ncbi:MAG: hypothetical protein ACTSWL_05735 [Promethearchaeota archaeon]